MRITYKWLKDFLKTEATPNQIADAFNRLGHEVEAIESTGYAYNNVVVGHVLETKKHPNADKLNICQVKVAEGDERQIICGAANVRAGITVAVALEGAVLPGDFKIKKSKIRGETSNGMICSERELNLGQDHKGIWEMDTDAAVGTPLDDLLPEADTIFELSITPNRGDALSVVGLVRDLAAGGLGTQDQHWAENLIKTAENANKATFTPKIETPECPYFCGISVKGIDNTVPTPAYIVERLEAAGLRPINAAVDISQYVMLTFGQPLHFYDADKLAGGIVAREARGGETLDALDDQTYTLHKGDLTIEDANGIVSLAGIVGCATHGAEEDTQNVYIEAAQFNRTKIAQTGQKLQVNSDARYRFERGIDPAQTKKAAYVAAALLSEVCGGKASIAEEVGTQLPTPVTITFDPMFVKTFGGLDLPAEESKALLEALGFKVTEKGPVFDVVVPTYLTMHSTPEDLVEDILRLKGYEAVPAILPALNLNPITTAAPEAKIQAFTRRHLATMGYFEANSYSFISHEGAKLFGGGDPSLQLLNPIDAEGMRDMRPSLLPGLIQAANRNFSRGEQHIYLAEVGTTFHPEVDKEKGLDHTEKQKVAALRLGPSHPRHPTHKPEEADVFALKADVFSLLQALGHDVNRVMVRPQAPEWFHPGRSGELVVQGRVVGHFGELHPQTLKKMRIKQKICVFEVDLSLLNQMKIKAQPFAMSTYQRVHRDFAFVLGREVPAEKLLATVKRAGKALVTGYHIFDVYEGEHLPEGKKSLAVRVTLQAQDRTLSEEEITQISDAIITAAEKNLAAEIRQGA